MRKPTVLNLKNTTLAITFLLAAYLIASPLIFTNKKPEKLSSLSLKKFKKVLVFAPHPDDEIIGCACTLAKLKRYGADIKVVILTNGEGFKYAVQLANLTPAPPTVDYFKFAYERQSETLRALKKIGIEKKNIYFLGFPDRGISKMWTSNWSEKKPFKSPFTHKRFSPFRNSYIPRIKYTGVTLKNVIESFIEKEEPDVILLPHPDDSHVDHWSTYCFINYALNDLLAKGYPVQDIKMLTYLVHRGDFPLPPGYRPDLTLQPPATLLKSPSTQWKVFNNSKRLIALKNDAVLTYKSQLLLLKGFMLKFVRKNELFGVISPERAAECYDEDMRLDGKPGDWQFKNPVVYDPTRDTFLRTLEGNADLKRIWIAKSSQNLYVRLDARAASSRFYNYKIDLSCFPATNLTSPPLRFIITIKPPIIREVKWIQGSSNAFRAKVKAGRVIELRIPLSGINFPSRIMIGASSSGPLQPLIDRTAYGTVYLN